MPIKYKGAIPIEKNVIVVDEQGNEYEATYPKRAKGLVKNGRARFVDENTICLACPPNENLEDNEMSEKLTQREIFEKIAELQAQLTNMKDTLFQFQCVRDNLVLVEDEEASYNQEVALEKLKTIKEVFAIREASLNSLLDFYKTMYNDLRNDEKAEKISVSESEAELKRRKEFLNFVKDTTAVAAGASLPDSVAPALLPNFEEIWKTVFLDR